MLVHLAPNCLSPWNHDISLISVEVPELELLLLEGEHLNSRRPYPNKQYLVASAKAERAAKDGFFILVDRQLTDFHVVSRWIVKGQEMVSEHSFKVLDQEFDAISPDATIWYQTAVWDNRWPDSVPSVAPMELKPTLKIDQAGNKEQTDTRFVLPSLQRERVRERAGQMLPGNRTPSIEAAFTV